MLFSSQDNRGGKENLRQVLACIQWEAVAREAPKEQNLEKWYVEKDASCIPTLLYISKDSLRIAVEHEKQWEQDAKVLKRGIWTLGKESSLTMTP